MEFIVGDVVILKSGGPPMTVEQVGKKSYVGEEGEDAVWCTWFETVGKKRVVKHETFSPGVLKSMPSRRSPAIGIQF